MPTPTRKPAFVSADVRANSAQTIVESLNYRHLPADDAIEAAMADLMVLATRMGFGYDRLVQNARRAARSTLSDGRSEVGRDA
jgi:hypothetical protein